MYNRETVNLWTVSWTSLMKLYLSDNKCKILFTTQLKTKNTQKTTTLIINILMSYLLYTVYKADDVISNVVSQTSNI